MRPPPAAGRRHTEILHLEDGHSRAGQAVGQVLLGGACVDFDLCHDRFASQAPVRGNLGYVRRRGLRILSAGAAADRTAYRAAAHRAPGERSKAAAPGGPPVRQLAGQLSETRLLRHLRALQKIADKHGGNRAAETPGYDASVDYVVGVLRDAGFKVSTPTFEASGWDGEGAGESQRNVIAQTRTGDPGNIVMIGAHLDSVEDGPGIVDNGSGVASLLEIATQLGANPSVQNMARFAFFGAEENGAQGRPATWRACRPTTARRSSCI
jgi:Peptidase family M28